MLKHILSFLLFQLFNLINLITNKYEKEGSIYFLRIIIDKEPYIDVEDCVIVSKVINPLLDEADLIEDE